MVDLRSIAQPLHCTIFFVSVCSGLNSVPIERCPSPNLLVHDLNWKSCLSRSRNDPRFGVGLKSKDEYPYERRTLREEGNEKMEAETGVKCL